MSGSLYTSNKQRKKLFGWLRFFFDPFFPYLKKILEDPDFHKDQPISDIGKYFIRAQALPKDKIFEMVFMVPDDGLIYELFITALVLKLKVSKKEIVQSFRDYAMNLKKYGDFVNISELTYRTVTKNLEDDHDVFAVKQDPDLVIDRFINFLRNKGGVLGMKEEDFVVVQDTLKKHKPKFLIKNVS